ncbi:hypothetical protein ACEUE7_05830 [Micrococcus endophyticus]|uniref:hypothetical protein n=1 Tax=Micrococcus endophyticus TaxID=455343 RepID=UPI0035A95672
MRIVLFDGIQEAHVAESLARALTAAGHEVHHTGRFGAGYVFRDTDDLLPVVAPHLERIAELRPDVVLVFRPASAPWPVLQALRATGAVLVAWFSDDPVLFEHSYGPVVDLYDLVLHCGGAPVLRFYEERFGRPTGVNLPFWTDHTAFPVVHGARPAETDVLFLGNMVGPVRRWRYDALAAMEHEVTVFGQVGEDPAGLGGGFLDAEHEVVQAGARARVALNIPQVFADHRGQPTWFPGLDALGAFELPSRVIQYAAMGLPTVSVVPGGAPTPAFPEMPVVDTVQDADRWIAHALGSGELEALSAAAVDRFDRSFSADARVLALESLLQDDDWRRLDADERAVWFLRFDGRRPRRPAAAAAAGPAEGDRREADASAPAERIAVRADVAVVHARPARRFDPLDVLLRELAAAGRLALALGPDHPDAGLLAADPTAEDPSAVRVDGAGLADALAGTGARVVVLAGGARLTAEDADALRAAGVATVGLLTDERPEPSALARFDLAVQIGPAPADHAGLLRGLPNAVLSPGLVESALLAALEARPARPGLLHVGAPEGSAPDAAGLSILESLADHPAAGGRADAPAAVEGQSPEALARLGHAALADALRRSVLHLAPETHGRLQAHPPITPLALCAAEHVLTTRHRRFRDEDAWGDAMLKAATAQEARLKLSRRAADRRAAQDAAEPDALGPAAPLGLAEHRRRFDAAAQVSDWLRRARERHEARAADPAGEAEGRRTPDDVPAPLADGTDALVPLDRRWPLAAEAAAWPPARARVLRLSLADAGLVAGVRVWAGEELIGEAAAGPEGLGAVDVVLTGAPSAPPALELVGTAGHRLRAIARVRVRARIGEAARRADAGPAGPCTASVLPAPHPAAGPAAGPAERTPPHA